MYNNLDDLDNNRNLGTIIGMTCLGFVGFVAVGFTVIGLVGGGCLGICLGRYTGKKITKKISKKNGLFTHFETYFIRILASLSWYEGQLEKYSMNINLIRFSLEEIIF